MTRPRDTQKSKVYAAENATFAYGQTIANADLQARVNEILDRRAIRSRWGAMRVTVQLGRGGGWAAGSRISLGARCRTDWMILHELAHVLTPTSYASHGPEYVGVYLLLVETILGKEAAARLRAAFKAGRVKSSRKAIPAVLGNIPPSRADREREARSRARAEAERRIREMVRRGDITKAAARRAVDAA